ncbi:MAG: M1 family metallopeptidase [Acidobacteriota bacterium]
MPQRPRMSSVSRRFTPKLVAFRAIAGALFAGIVLISCGPDLRTATLPDAPTPSDSAMGDDAGITQETNKTMRSKQTPMGDAAAGAVDSTASAPEQPDVHSFANAVEVTVKHLALDLDVDFETRRLEGRASLHLDRHAPTSRLVLDTRDLEIRGVFLDDGTTPAVWRLGEAVEFLGRPLEIELKDATRSVHVDYATSPDAGALLWLEPSQTAGGRHPFLFTQSQAILARTWVPIQDSPGVRFTYEATVRAPTPLIALMSAENPIERSASGVYSFRMPQPIPSYLLALAVGDLTFAPIGDRTGIYAEPPVLERAVYEFGETEEMMTAVEALYGPYRWGRYDILVLPAGFPFGGMENPRLTFVTPTILAGDRSLVSLIAHELAHSWSGNLVTNATWNDFWLNEGFTVYLERRIMEELEGRDYADMLTLLGLQDLEGTMAGLDARDTHLHLSLHQRDPDEGMTDVAYEKGYFFLLSIEAAVGRERFDAFIERWFEGSAFRSADTETFLAFLDRELLSNDAALRRELEVDRWVYGPGLPVRPAVVSERFEQVDRQLAAWADGRQTAGQLETARWTTHEWLRFLRGLPETMTTAQLAELDAAFGFTETGNSEMLHAWLHHAIAHRYEAAYPALDDFLTGMGRRKFLQPLYSRLAAGDDTRAMAIDIYRRARPGYHSVSTQTIDAILDWGDATASSD